MIKRVTPFGNSGHINVSKDAIGKYYLIRETSPIQEILTKKEIREIERQLDRELKIKTENFMHSIYKKTIRDYRDDLLNLFEDDDIDGIISFLAKNKKNNGIMKKLKVLSD